MIDTTPRRRRRWPRRILTFLAVVLLVVTDGSLIFDAATSPRAAVPAGLTYVQAGDVRTRYREWGRTGSPVVLVHGFIESADTWQGVGTRLAAAGHRVYALDLVGWGYSQHVPPYDLRHQAAQLIAFIRALHLDRPALVGHSSGAAIVAQAALDDPTAVGGLLFLDGDGLATGAGSRNPLTALMIDPYRTALLRLLVKSDWFIRTVYGVACGPRCAPLDAAGLEQWRRPLEIPGAEAAIWSMIRLGVPGLPARQLARLKSLPNPKLVVFGGADSTYSKDDPAQTAALIGAPTPTIIPGAAHLTPVNSPGQVTTAIEQLVAG